VTTSTVVRSLATLAVGAAILSPIARDQAWDSFPISRYPMFARGNVGHLNSLEHVVLVRRDGTRSPASPGLVGTVEPMIALSIVRSHVDQGTAGELCATVAERAREASADVVAVEVVSSTFDTRRYLAGDTVPVARTTHARCNVGR
jgi:hypothetical protein